MPQRNLTIKERFNLINDCENNNFHVLDASNKYKCNKRTVFRCLSNQTAIKEANNMGHGKVKR